MVSERNEGAPAPPWGAAPRAPFSDILFLKCGNSLVFRRVLKRSQRVNHNRPHDHLCNLSIRL